MLLDLGIGIYVMTWSRDRKAEVEVVVACCEGDGRGWGSRANWTGNVRLRRQSVVPFCALRLHDRSPPTLVPRQSWGSRPRIGIATLVSCNSSLLFQPCPTWYLALAPTL